MSFTVSVELALVAGQRDPHTADFTVDEKIEKAVLVANSAVDQSIDVSEIATGKLLFLKSDKNVSVRFANGGTQFTVEANKPLLMPANVSGVFVSNSSGSAATITLKYYG